RFKEAIAENGEAIRLKPDDPPALNNLSWLLATCREVQLRDPRKAVELGKRAVELAPQEAGYWNTLGIAHYRNGDWKASIEVLTQSVQRRKSSDRSAFREGGDSSDFFFLAMAHWQLGDKKAARVWYDKAVQCMDKNEPKDAALRRFRAEAAAL